MEIVLHLIIIYGRVQGLFGMLIDCMLFGSARSVYRGASILHRIFSNKGGRWFISAFENSRVEVEWVESTWVKLLYDIAGTIANWKIPFSTQDSRMSNLCTNVGLHWRSLVDCFWI
jgi:hypothetical protein